MGGWVDGRSDIVGMNAQVLVQHVIKYKHADNEMKRGRRRRRRSRKRRRRRRRRRRRLNEKVSGRIHLQYSPRIHLHM